MPEVNLTTEEITDTELRMVESAEDLLHRRGFAQVRVRCHGAVARIEVEPEERDRLALERRAIVARLKEAGFSDITLDPEGYRSGSMDGVL